MLPNLLYHTSNTSNNYYYLRTDDRSNQLTAADFTPPHLITLSLHLGRKTYFVFSSIYLWVTTGLVKATSVVCLVGVSFSISSFLVYKLYRVFYPSLKKPNENKSEIEELNIRDVYTDDFCLECQKQNIRKKSRSRLYDVIKNNNNKQNGDYMFLNMDDVNSLAKRDTEEDWIEGEVDKMESSSDVSKESIFDDVMLENVTLEKLEVLQRQISLLSGEVCQMNDKMESLQDDVIRGVEEEEKSRQNEDGKGGVCDNMSKKSSTNNDGNGDVMNKRQDKNDVMNKRRDEQNVFAASQKYFSKRVKEEDENDEEDASYTAHAHMATRPSSIIISSPEYEKLIHFKFHPLNLDPNFPTSYDVTPLTPSDVTEKIKEKEWLEEKGEWLEEMGEGMEEESTEDLYIEDEFMVSDDEGQPLSQLDYVNNNQCHNNFINNKNNKTNENITRDINKITEKVMNSNNNNNDNIDVNKKNEKCSKLDNMSDFLEEMVKKKENYSQVDEVFKVIGRSLVVSSLTTLKNPSDILQLVMKNMGEKVPEVTTLTTFHHYHPHLTFSRRQDYDKVFGHLATERVIHIEKGSCVRAVFMAALKQDRLTSLKSHLLFHLHQYLTTLTCSKVLPHNTLNLIKQSLKDFSDLLAFRNGEEEQTRLVKRFHFSVSNDRNTMLEKCLLDYTFFNHTVLPAIKSLMLITCSEMYVDFVKNPFGANYLALMIFCGKATLARCYEKHIRFLADESTLSDIQLSLLASSLHIKLKHISFSDSSLLISHHPSDNLNDVTKSDDVTTRKVVAVVRNRDGSYLVPDYL